MFFLASKGYRCIAHDRTLKEEYCCRLLKWRVIKSGLEQLQEMKNMAEQEELQ